MAPRVANQQGTVHESNSRGRSMSAIRNSPLFLRLQMWPVYKRRSTRGGPWVQSSWKVHEYNPEKPLSCLSHFFSAAAAKEAGRNIYIYFLKKRNNTPPPFDVKDEGGYKANFSKTYQRASLAQYSEIRFMRPKLFFLKIRIDSRQDSHLNPLQSTLFSRLGIHKQMNACWRYLDPRWSSTTSKSAHGLQKVGIIKPLFRLTVGSINKSSLRS